MSRQVAVHPLAPALALALTLALAPHATAQVPDVPDLPPPPAVEDAVALACSLAPADLPVCPQDEPTAPPQPPGEEAHEHDASPAPAAPGTPQDAGALAAQATDDAQGIAEDPTSAPDRLASLAATLLQFVKDLLDLPRQGLQALDADRLEAKASLAQAATATTTTIRDATHALTRLDQQITQNTRDALDHAARATTDGLTHALDAAHTAATNLKTTLTDLFTKNAPTPTPPRPRGPLPTPPAPRPDRLLDRLLLDA